MMYTVLNRKNAGGSLKINGVLYSVGFLSWFSLNLLLMMYSNPPAFWGRGLRGTIIHLFSSTFLLFHLLKKACNKFIVSTMWFRIFLV